MRAAGGFSRLRQRGLHVRERRAVEVQFLGLVLREITNAQAIIPKHIPAGHIKPPGQQLRQRGFAIAIGTQQRHAIFLIQPKRQIPQYRRSAITDRSAIDRQDRRRQSLRRRKGKTHGRVFHQRFHRRHTFQRLQPRLRLARLGGLGAKAIHKRLNARAFRYQLCILRLLLRLAFRPDAQEIREIP